ncbi:DUF4019 domain-containing protein [Halomonas sp. SpR8]|uniref:DUF4019 domain-containing protein n=1 Tax=Halomonas sp. SpR8 TaxID=3050463 RepID=UPI0027E4BC5F|nr:DUF4019 domain-containing protein [Halomonas sp. SpR8]MDQ7729949.1 DUF4019 domain-containing protein [Halomonas sp. SpR8]
MKKVFCLVCFLIFSQPLLAASDAEIESAVQWLEVIDSGEYEESWNLTGSLFQDQLSASQWVQALVQVRQPLGDIKSREVSSSSSASSLPGAPDGEYIVITYASNFENESNATETVTLRQEDEEWRPVGYFVQ